MDRGLGALLARQIIGMLAAARSHAQSGVAGGEMYEHGLGPRVGDVHEGRRVHEQLPVVLVRREIERYFVGQQRIGHGGRLHHGENEPTGDDQSKWHLGSFLVGTRRTSRARGGPQRQYGPLSGPGNATNWSGRRDSNPRPRPWQGRALPLSYTRIRRVGRPAKGVRRSRSYAKWRPALQPSPCRRRATSGE